MNWQMDGFRYLTMDDYLLLAHRFPRGLLVQKTTQYPTLWTERAAKKSMEAIVVGYGRSSFRPLRVRRIGLVALEEAEPEWWEPVTS